jgi:hypothetical protein
MDDGRLKSREAGASIRERRAFATALFVAEGGRLIGNAAATAGQRFLLPAGLRRMQARRVATVTQSEGLSKYPGG